MLKERNKKMKKISLLITMIISLLASMIFPNSAFAFSNNHEPIRQMGLNNDVSTNGTLNVRLILLDDNTFRARMEKAYGTEVAKKVHRDTTSYPSPQGVSAATPTNTTIWSGYVLDAKNSSTYIYDVTSQMTARYCYVQPPETFANVYDFEWSGIGGFGTPALLQAGVDMHNHSAFTEAIPGDQTAQEHFSVNPGDTIDTAVYYVSGTEWFVSVYDENSSQAWGNDYSFSAPPFSDGQGHNCNQADWIVETPCIPNTNPQQQYYIGHFLSGSYGTVNFWNCHWYDSSWTQRNMDYVPANSTLWKVTESTLNSETMTPSTITSNSFSIGH
jgi:hypothetical protein